VAPNGLILLSVLFSDIPTELKSKGIFHTTKILIVKTGDESMKKITLVFLLLVVISTMLIAGCTTKTVAITPATTPAPAPAVTAVQTYVQNQQGVAIIKTVNVTATPTAAVQATQTGEVRIAQNVVVKPETVSKVTNKTEQIVSNVTNKTEQIVSNLTNKTGQIVANLTK
jgi:hypothetical protein